MYENDNFLTIKKFICEFYGSARAMSKSVNISENTIKRNMDNPKGAWISIISLYKKYEELKRIIDNQ